MKTFDKSLEEKLKELPYTPHLDDGGYNDGVIDGFESGANWASKSPELINEIIDKYFMWTRDLPITTVKRWSKEEGSDEKTEARIRKEFIEYLNQKG